MLQCADVRSIDSPAASIVSFLQPFLNTGNIWSVFGILSHLTSSRPPEFSFFFFELSTISSRSPTHIGIAVVYYNYNEHRYTISTRYRSTYADIYP